MIQMINYSGVNKEIKDSEIKISRISNPQSLDEFDINIIDLGDELIWRNDPNSNKSINCINDFVNLNIMVNNSKQTKVIYMFPTDLVYRYYVTSSGAYLYNGNLKDMLSIIKGEILIKLFPDFNKINIIYENTKTSIANNEISSSFFINYYDSTSLTNSIGSNKVTTIDLKGKIITTLRLKTDNDIKNFLKQIGLIEDKLDIPEWIIKYDFFDDNKQKEIIQKSNEIISTAQTAIDLANTTLDNNNNFKSILYTNGNYLVTVVFKMLEELLEVDMSKFVDENKEDFLIKKSNITFIGEIKGVTSNVRSEHISQLDNHYHGYKDKLVDEGKEENVKSILIINHQRNIDIIQRQPIHIIQIDLAKRNGSLIIETTTLLKLFEKFKAYEITSEDFQRRIETEAGLMAIN